MEISMVVMMVLCLEKMLAIAMAMAMAIATVVKVMSMWSWAMVRKEWDVDIFFASTTHIRAALVGAILCQIIMYVPDYHLWILYLYSGSFGRCYDAPARLSFIVVVLSDTLFIPYIKGRLTCSIPIDFNTRYL